MVSSLIFRPAVARDIDQLVAIEQACFATPWDRAAFEYELTINQYAYYLVIESEQTIIGYAGAGFIFDEGHITNVGILPTYRGQGLGLQLMQQLIAQAQKQQVSYLTLEVRESNVIAQRLYQKLTFRPVALRKKYYSDNQEDALIMRVDFNKESEDVK